MELVHWFPVALLLVDCHAHPESNIATDTPIAVSAEKVISFAEVEAQGPPGRMVLEARLDGRSFGAVLLGFPCSVGCAIGEGRTYLEEPQREDGMRGYRERRVLMVACGGPALAVSLVGNALVVNRSGPPMAYELGSGRYRIDPRVVRESPRDDRRCHFSGAHVEFTIQSDLMLAMRISNGADAMSPPSDSIELGGPFSRDDRLAHCSFKGGGYGGRDGYRAGSFVQKCAAGRAPT